MWKLLINCWGNEKNNRNSSFGRLLFETTEQFFCYVLLWWRTTTSKSSREMKRIFRDKSARAHNCWSEKKSRNNIGSLEREEKKGESQLRFQVIDGCDWITTTRHKAGFESTESSKTPEPHSYIALTFHKNIQNINVSKELGILELKEEKIDGCWFSEIKKIPSQRERKLEKAIDI